MRSSVTAGLFQIKDKERELNFLSQTAEPGVLGAFEQTCLQCRELYMKCRRETYSTGGQCELLRS